MPISKLPMKTLPLLAAIICQGATAGAWVPAEGEGYTKIAYSNYEASDFYGISGMDVDFEGVNTSFYGEYGLGNNWAIFGTVLHQDLDQTINGVKTSGDGFGDAELGLRYQWTDADAPLVISSSFLVKIPSFYDEDDALPLGNGQEDYEAKILIGRSLNEYGYIGVEAGYRLRTGSPSDEYRYLLEYGVSVNDNLYLRTKLDGIQSATNGDNNNNTVGNLSATPEYDLGKLELTAGWLLGNKKAGRDDRWGVELTYTQDVYGDQTLEGDSLQFGLTKTF